MTYQTIAMIKHSVRFRGKSHSILPDLRAHNLIHLAIADFQWNTGNSTFLRRLDEVVDCRDGSIFNAVFVIANR